MSISATEKEYNHVGQTSLGEWAQGRTSPINKSLRTLFLIWTFFPVRRVLSGPS